MMHYIDVPGLLFFFIYGGFGVGVLGLGYCVNGVWSLWCGALWIFWGWGSLYKHIRITFRVKIVPSMQTLGNFLESFRLLSDEDNS